MSTFNQILNEYNQEVYGYSNDQAFPSMGRIGPNPLSTLDPLAAHTTMEGAEVLGHAEGVHGASQSHQLHTHFSAPAGEMYFNLGTT